MKILFAESDRDLLMCYKKLLSMDGHEVTDVFDGVQTAIKTSIEDYDLVILDNAIPCADSDRIITSLNNKNVPVVILTGQGSAKKRVSKNGRSNTYLRFPFSPGEMRAAIAQAACR